MKTKKTTLITILSLLFFQAMVLTGFAQIKYTARDNVKLAVSGTSTLHDWEMTSSNGACDAFVTLAANGRIASLSNLIFVTQVGELKSGKGAMDKNAYKALKKDKYATISYIANTATVATTDGVNYSVKSTGKLTIAGTSHDVDLISSLKLNPDKTITVSGFQKIQMKNYGVEPPTFMFGAVKTGNDITIKFDLTLKK